MALEESTDHVARARALLLEQFKSKPNIAAYLNARSARAQDIEAALFEILTETALDNAVGESLNMLGRIVGEDRQGRDDATYRLRVRARIKLNLMSGTVEEILELLSLVLGSAYTFTLTQYPPASFRFDVHGAIDAATAGEAARLLAAGRAAGVGAQLVYSTVEDSEAFTFASGDTVEADAARGWGDDTGTTGGYLVEVLDA